MGKLIAVWGTPDSGKTTVSVKLADAINTRTKTDSEHSVIVVFTDLLAPVLPILFPLAGDKNMYSLGDILSKSEISKNAVMSNAITVKGRGNLAFFGYKKGENERSYPSSTENKMKEFLEILKNSAEYVIVDCMAIPEMDMLTKLAIQEADMCIRLLNPDYKCYSFLSSQLSLLKGSGLWKTDDLSFMNINTAEGQYLMNDLKEKFENISTVIPYSFRIREQWLSGNLTDHIHDRKFQKVMNAIREVVVS